jgi:hypothetical protein
VKPLQEYISKESYDLNGIRAYKAQLKGLVNRRYEFFIDLSTIAHVLNIDESELINCLSFNTTAKTSIVLIKNNKEGSKIKGINVLKINHALAVLADNIDLDLLKRLKNEINNLIKNIQGEKHNG